MHTLGGGNPVVSLEEGPQCPHSPGRVLGAHGTLSRSILYRAQLISWVFLGKIVGSPGKTNRTASVPERVSFPNWQQARDQTCSSATGGAPVRAQSTLLFGLRPWLLEGAGEWAKQSPQS